MLLTVILNACFLIILEEDPDVIRWIKPPLNQLGLFWQAGQQYNPDFLVETTSGKFMVEVKASNEVTADDVVRKLAKESNGATCVYG